MLWTTRIFPVKKMPTIDQNKLVWEKRHHWNKAGDEWSASWGGGELEWAITLSSRLHKLLPTGNLLEIAPGFGRWTRFLLPLCESYIGVDLAQKCIDACKERFSDVSNASFHVGDGKTLKMVDSSSVDFLFSFDSLVHVDWEVMDSYIEEFARVLKPGARAFVHHSNLGHYMKGGVAQIAKTCWRGEDVTAERVRAKAEGVGLACVSQEKIAWFVPELVDCITVFAQPAPGEVMGQTVIKENYDFPQEGKIGREIAVTYAGQVFPETPAATGTP